MDPVAAMTPEAPVGATPAPEAAPVFFPDSTIDHWTENQQVTPDPATPDPVPAAAPPPAAAPEVPQGGDPNLPGTPEAAPDPDRVWLQQADTTLQVVGGRDFLNDVVDYAGRLFGSITEGPGFVEKLATNAPGVYADVENQIISRMGENIPEALEVKVFEKYGINAENIDNYRLVDVYGLDRELIQSDAMTSALLEALNPEQRQIFHNAPKDIRAEIVEAYEKDRPTTVERLLKMEKTEQQEKKVAEAAALEQERAKEYQLAEAVNTRITQDVASLVEGYAKQFKIPMRYASGIMADAIQGMRSADANSPIAVHYNGFIAAVRAKNEILQHQHATALRTLADQAFRNELLKEQADHGDYNFQGFYKPMVQTPAPAPRPAAPAPAQPLTTPQRLERMVAEHQPPNENWDLNEILHGNAG